LGAWRSFIVCDLDGRGFGRSRGQRGGDANTPRTPGQAGIRLRWVGWRAFAGGFSGPSDSFPWLVTSLSPLRHPSSVLPNRASMWPCCRPAALHEAQSTLASTPAPKYAGPAVQVGPRLCRRSLEPAAMVLVLALDCGHVSGCFEEGIRASEADDYLRPRDEEVERQTTTTRRPGAQRQREKGQGPPTGRRGATSAQPSPADPEAEAGRRTAGGEEAGCERPQGHCTDCQIGCRPTGHYGSAPMVTAESRRTSRLR